ncbi:MAG: CHAT domain-containing protein [Bacteroidia bacterium]
MWKNNVVLHDVGHNSYAHVKEDWAKKRICVDLYGTEVRSLYEGIESTLKGLIAELKSTKYLNQLDFESRIWDGNEWISLSSAKKREELFFSKTKQTENVQEVKNNSSKTSEIMKILFLSANPTNQARLQTDREFDLIDQRIKEAEYRERFSLLNPKLSLTIEKLILAMNQDPEIVHFAGHGEKEGIQIVNGLNESLLMPVNVLNRLFKDRNTRLVILNSCYSTAQAEVISKLGMYVIGMNASVEDLAALDFVSGIYLGLGAGKTIDKSFVDGLIILETKHPKYAKLPEIWKDGKNLTDQYA